MPDILVRPTANDDDDLTDAFIIDDASLPLSAQSAASLGMTLGTSYEFQVLGTPETLIVTGVPSAFVDANWSVATGAGSASLDVTISSLPAANGQTITDVEYELDASGTWVSSGGTGSFSISGLTASTSYDVRLRAVNANGNGTAGNTESAASSAAATGLSVTYLGSDTLAGILGTYTFSSKTLGTGTIIVGVGLRRNAAFTIGSVAAGSGPAATSPMTDGVTSAIRGSGSSLQAAFYAVPCTDATGDIVITLSAGTAFGARVSWWLVEGDFDVHKVVTADSTTTPAPWSVGLNIATVADGAAFAFVQSGAPVVVDFDTVSGITSRGVLSYTTDRNTIAGDVIPTTDENPRTIAIGDSDAAASGIASGVSVSIKEAA